VAAIFKSKYGELPPKKSPWMPKDSEGWQEFIQDISPKNLYKPAELV
jgi:hypothetical protein